MDAIAGKASLARRVGQLASRQHGVVSRAQLQQLGMSRGTINAWIRQGRLWKVHRGVYSVGHAPTTFHARCMAAVLACGPGARLTAAAAGYLRGAERRQPRVIEVAAAREVRSRLAGVEVIYSRGHVPSGDAAVDGIPVVDVPRMVVDRAATAGAMVLADIMHELEFHDLLDIDAVETCAHSLHNRHGKGPGRLRDAIKLQRKGSAGSQSAFERANLAWLLERGAPMPEITPKLIGRDGRSARPDMYWPEWGLVGESDGRPHDRIRTQVADKHKDLLYSELDLHCCRIHHATVEQDRWRLLNYMWEIGMVSRPE